MDREKNVENLVRVLYDFKYNAKDGREISVRQGEKLYLINKTNTDWWQVIRSTKERPFFVPAQYVVEQLSEYQNIPTSRKVQENLPKPVPKTRTKLRRPSKESLSDNNSDKEPHNHGDTKNRMKNSYNLKSPEFANRRIEIKLSPSLEKLAEEIKFKPKTQNNDPTTSKTGKSVDADVVLNEKPLAKPRPSLWSSFKRKQNGTKKLKEACVLSSSWEGGLDKIPEKCGNAQITGGGLQRSRTFMFPEKSKESPRRLDAYNGKIKSTFTTFKPLQNRQLTPYENIPRIADKTAESQIRKSPKPLHSSATMELVADIQSDCDPDLEEKSLPKKISSKLVQSQISVESTHSNMSDESEINGKPLERMTNKRTSIVRRQRVDSSRRLRIPPTPPVGLMPLRDLKEGWGEYKTDDGRVYYFNRISLEKNWKPPRKQILEAQHGGSKDSLASEQSSSSPLTSRDSKTPSPLESTSADNLPSEEEAVESSDHVFQGTNRWAGQSFSKGPYIRRDFGLSTTNEKWSKSAELDDGNFKVPDNKRWKLPGLASPDTPYSIQRSATESAINQKGNDVKLSEVPPIKIRQDNNVNRRLTNSTRVSKTQSMIIDHKSDEDISQYNKCLKSGILNRTRITENGQSIRKNWMSSFVVLYSDHLLQVRDEKNFALYSKDPQSVRHMKLPLAGANLEEGGKISSRKNVYKLTASDGKSAILLQSNNRSDMSDWIICITCAIAALSSPLEKSTTTSSSSSLEPSPTNKISRSKSMKAKSKLTGSTDDLNENADENRKKIRDRLKKFFSRRPHVDYLRQQQIYKDEPVFGSSLEQLTKQFKDEKIPEFVVRCIEVIESKEENMKTDGLYRASGNLSQVQKIRLQVDQGKLDGLEQEEDVHVLAGCLKLFFRELKEPLIPFTYFKKALHAITSKNEDKKIKDFREIIDDLPTANKDTLTFLLRHLHRVQSYCESNRMHIQNLAIVFGPTLMWTEEESYELAFELMQQNQVVECLLIHFDKIFSKK